MERPVLSQKHDNGFLPNQSIPLNILQVENGSADKNQQENDPRGQIALHQEIGSTHGGGE